MKIVRPFFAGISVLLFSASAASARPVVENFDRFEMNWTTMRLRYFGESLTNKSFDQAEKEATDQGLLYALANVSKIREEKGLSATKVGDIANAVSKQSFAYNTVYFSNGKVRVELETSLALALDPGRQPFSPKPIEVAEGGVRASSVVIEVAGLNSPTPINEVVDNYGNLTYTSGDVSPEAYRKNLTGRWFYLNSSELKSFVGSEPIIIRGSYGNGKLVVDKAAWEAARQGASKALADGRVAFVLSRAD